MMLRNNIFLSLFLIIAFSVMGKAQEINKEHPLPPPSLEDGDGVCHLRFDILILEVTVINREGYITNLRHEDFEVFYENRKHVVDFFTLGEILLKADNEEENKSITNSITK